MFEFDGTLFASLIESFSRYFTILILTQCAMSLPSPEPLEKFPHPYVAHPKPDHHPLGHEPRHHEVGPGPVPGPLPDHPPDHHEEHKLPKKCHTEYVSVISKVRYNFTECTSRYQ